MSNQLGVDPGTGPPPPAPRPERRPGRGTVITLVVAAVALASCLAATIAAGIEAAHAADDAEQLRSGAWAGPDVGHEDLITSLQDERNLATVYMLGFEESLDLPVADNGEARARTDQAVDRLRGAVDEYGDAAAAYRPALAQLDGITDIRDRIDAAAAAGRDSANADESETVFVDYSALIAAVFDARSQAVPAGVDPALRRGLELVDLSSQQIETIALISRQLLLAAIDDGLNTPDEIADVSGDLALLRENQALIAELATGDLQEHADALLASEDVNRFPQLVEAALVSGQVDMTEILDALPDPDPNPDASGYTAFRDGVSDTLAERTDELENAASSRQLRFTVEAVAALAAVLAAVVVIVIATIALARSGRRRGHLA